MSNATRTADLILGIETSCDDTSVALVSRSGEVIACKTVSQYEVHEGYGGVYPELASRAHLQAILPVVREVLDVIGGRLERIAAIGVTRGPGLIGSLLIGVSTAEALGAAWGIKVIGINHLRGHLRSPDLETPQILYPAIVLLVSGGHTVISHLISPAEIVILGATRDDSVGETYDKVARMLGLGMPGGPAIDRLASQGEAKFTFPRPMLKEGYEFSFSGLKSSVARLVETQCDAARMDVASSFVAACLDILEAKVVRALSEHGAKSVVIVGGVSASPQLRARMSELCQAKGVACCFAPLGWATDNAAMIALATWDYLDRDPSCETRPHPNLPLDAW